MSIIRLSGCIVLGTLFGITTAEVLEIPTRLWWLDVAFCFAYMMGLYCFTCKDRR